MPGGKNCCVVGCTNYNLKTNKVSYVSFPKSSEKNDEWRRQLIVAVARADDRFNPDTHHICTAHFEPKCLLCHGKYNNRGKYWCIFISVKTRTVTLVKLKVELA